MEALEPYRGAPLRTGLEGSSLGRPGLAIVGEAGGTTYAVSGEGIGKAMESSLLMAELAVASRRRLSEVGPEFARDDASAASGALSCLLDRAAVGVVSAPGRLHRAPRQREPVGARHA